MSKFELKSNGTSIDIFTPYSADFVSGVKKLGAKWNSSSRCWTASEDKIEEVKELIKTVYGESVDLPAEMLVKVTFYKRFDQLVDDDEIATIMGVKIADSENDYLSDLHFNGECTKKMKDGKITRIKIMPESELTLKLSITDFDKYSKFDNGHYTVEIIK